MRAGYDRGYQGQGITCNQIGGIMCGRRVKKLRKLFMALQDEKITWRQFKREWMRRNQS